MKIDIQYAEKVSPIHVLNPLVKLTWVAAVTVSAMIINHPVWLGALLLATVPIVITAKMGRQWADLMQATLYLCLVIILINVLVNHNGGHILWQAGFKIPVLGYPAVSAEALIFSLGMSLRLLVIISTFAIMTLTIHPDDILQAMYRIKMPAKSVLVISLATRFLPVLAADAERISAVQRSRGLEMDRGSLFRRIKNRTAVLIPLLANSLDRTVALAEAMEARAFGSGRKRGFFKPLAVRVPDRVGIAAGAFSLLTTIAAAWKGWSAYQYFPRYSPAGLSIPAIAALAVLILLVLMPIPVGWLEKRMYVD